VIDPVCDSEVNCFGAYLTTFVGSTEVNLVDDVNRLATASVRRSGAVTDGATLLLIRVSSNSAVSFSIKTPSGGSPTANEWGVLTDRHGSSSGSFITIQPEVTTQGNIAFAAYKTPLNFPGNSNSRMEKITIEATSSSGNVNTTLDLLRPPIVLVHGVWSDSGAWQQLDTYLTDRGFTVLRPDYRADSAGSFDPKDVGHPYLIATVNLATLQARESLRSSGIAVTQVDVVGHSLGGLIARKCCKDAIF